METILVLILLLSPFIGFSINLLVGKKLTGRTLPGIIATTAVALSFVISVYLFIYIAFQRALYACIPIIVHCVFFITFSHYSQFTLYNQCHLKIYSDNASAGFFHKQQ